ncbi:hypothetical protein JCM4814A_08800 [Streptomyces phaeofaciens JCM 4814]|uniref:Uncharacterized protein n=1 Tax=Streptomyces phaeofaciens TaxID=68254 RepID=A0A918HR62_9ACTN|nr:hypothetical protein GCM10010226_81130 [Streptomyces phaeofaciens]
MPVPFRRSGWFRRRAPGMEGVAGDSAVVSLMGGSRVLVGVLCGVERAQIITRHR